MKYTLHLILFLQFILIKLSAEQSSVSDFEKYKTTCLSASRVQQNFNSFKKNPAYTEILEHVTYEHGLAYYELISQNKEIMDHFQEFYSNDLYGSPNQFFYWSSPLLNRTISKQLVFHNHAKK